MPPQSVGAPTSGSPRLGTPPGRPSVGDTRPPPASTARFVAAARALRATADEAALVETADAVLARWSSPGRGYHSVVHLAEVLHLLDQLECDDPAVELAAWFHDAEYTGLPGQDESASAALAIRALADLGVSAEDTHRVSTLVLMTIDHVCSDDDLGAAQLCDADLAILAATPARYAEYAAGVRADYAHVPDDAFSAGRAAVLRRLVRRANNTPGREGPLYRTEFAARWTARAVANLEAELRDLEVGSA